MPPKNRNKEMHSILTKIQQLFDDKGIYPMAYSIVFDIIKILADNINYRNNEALLSSKLTEKIRTDFFMNMMYEADEIKNDQEIVIELGRHPVLSDMWNERKQLEALGMFSKKGVVWKEDNINHIYRLFLPMGLTVVVNGFHSINAGIVKNIGSLCFSPNSINNKIYDISSLYDKVYFDGTNYRNIENNKIVQGYEKDKSIFELGCIFEIGRIIHNEKQKGKPIDFVMYIKMYN